MLVTKILGRCRYAMELCGLLIGLTLSVSAHSGDQEQRLVLAGATLIDGVNDVSIRNSRIIIADGRFVCVSGPDGCSPSPGDDLLDVAGYWVTPGLIDAHTHLQLTQDSEATALAQRLRFALGVTAVRDAGTLQLEPLLALRELAVDAHNPVPRISISARPVEAYAETYGVEPGVQLVRHLVAIGVDGIKVKDHIQSDLYAEEIRTASELGVPVWGHTGKSMGPPPEAATELAIAAGLTGVTHLSWIAPFCQQPGSEVSAQPEDIEYYKWSKSYWMTTDSACLDVMISNLVEEGVWLEPTLVTEWYWWKQELEPPPHLAFLRTRPPSTRDLLTGHDVLAAMRPPTFPDVYPEMADFVKRFHDAGGVLVAGTDDVRPGLDLHTELSLLREAGLTPLESLQTATRDAAVALGRDDLGTIEVGKLADAVLYSADPLDIRGSTLHIDGVMKAGVVYQTAELLSEFRDRYRRLERQYWINRFYRLVPLLISAVLVLLSAISLVLRRRRSA